ncbi:MAG: hypothetical protein IKA72_02835 [Clostridia bacterium]|nr:hypothetical protein [Clostridia bacterium]
MQENENVTQKFDFISDLDEYFCENYENYDKLCVIKGYRMPKMQDTERRADGSLYSYTLPAKTMCLAKQEKRAEILKILKTQITDKSFSFSFEPAGFIEKLKKNFKYSFKRILSETLRKCAVSEEELGKELSIDQTTWKNICAGNYLPTKNLIFSIALTARVSYEDACMLLATREMEFDYTLEREVVIAYLLKQKVYNAEMIKAAFNEYSVSNLFITWLND